MIRETCIWETPRRRPISYWFRSSSKRSLSTRRSRSSSGASSARAGPRPRRSPARSVRPSRPSARTPILVGFAARRATGCDAPRRPAGPPRPPPRPGQARGDLRHGRVSPELVAERAGRLVDRHRPLLEPARQAHLPDAVAEVAPKLAEDRRRRVGDERPAALQVEAVERLDQAEAGDLDQVLELLAGAAVAQRQGARQRQEARDQLLLQRRIPRLGVALKQVGLAVRINRRGRP